MWYSSIRMYVSIAGEHQRLFARGRYMHANNVHARREYEKAGIWCVLPACCTWSYLRELISVEYKANLGTYMFAFGSLTALRSSEV